MNQFLSPVWDAPGENLTKFCSILIIAALLSTAAVAQEEQWQIVSPDSQGFSIEMPGEPQLTEQNVDTEAGPIEMTMYILEKQPEVYMIAHFDSPVDLSDTTRLNQSFDGARDRVLASQNGKLTFEGPITRGGYRGREIVFQLGTTSTAKMQLFYIGNRFFQLYAIMPRISGTSAIDAERFLSSFSFDESKMPAFDAAPPLLSRLFEEIGYNFKSDSASGRHETLLEFSDGRSHVIKVDSYSTGVPLDYDIVEIWAAVYRPEGTLADTLVKRLLMQNGNMSYGSFELIEGDSSSLVVFSAEYPLPIGAQAFKRLLLFVAEVADELEKELTGKDDL